MRTFQEFSAAPRRGRPKKSKPDRVEWLMALHAVWKWKRAQKEATHEA